MIASTMLITGALKHLVMLQLVSKFILQITVLNNRLLFQVVAPGLFLIAHHLEPLHASCDRFP